MDYESVDFVDLLDARLGLRNVRLTAGGVEVSYSCHRLDHAHGDDSPSAYINSSSGLFMCHGCEFSGAVYDLVADVQEVSRAQARRFLREVYGVSFDEPVGGSMAAETDARFRDRPDILDPPRPPESWLSSTRVDWRADDLDPWQEYALDRGLSRDVLEEFGVGYDFASDRVTIPVRDLDGRLVGAKGRDWRGASPAKYVVLGDSPRGRLSYGFSTYAVASVIFGLHRRRDRRSVVLLEGELDAIALVQLGVPRPVASGRAGLSDRQVDLLADECEEVSIYYDQGRAGERATDLAVELLEHRLMVRVVEPLDVDPCDALRLGREREVLEAIDAARSSLLARPHSGRVKRQEPGRRRSSDRRARST